MNACVEAWHKHAALGFLSLLSAPGCDPEDTSTFVSLINAAIQHYDVRPADMAKRFGVNPSTIGRWATGKNVPHVMVRPLIIDWIREYVREGIEKMECDDDLVKEAEEIVSQRKCETITG